MRLTKKNDIGIYESRKHQEDWANLGETNQKLGPLEDAEELCEKIVSQPIYEKFTDSGEIHEEDYSDYKALYNFRKRRIEIYGYEFIAWFELDGYGKTWSLDKKDLTNE